MQNRVTRIRRLINLDFSCCVRVLDGSGARSGKGDTTPFVPKSAILTMSLRASVLTTECLPAANLSFLFKLVSELSDKDNLFSKELHCDQHICRKSQLSNNAG